MKKYHKIKTCYLRDTATGKMTNQWITPMVDYLKDNKWYFTEKVDGTNIRVHWDGYEISFHGRNEKSIIPSGLLDCLNDKFAKESVAQIFEQLFGEKDVVLYGEGYGCDIQKYGKDYLDEYGFILFDITINDNYLCRQAVEDIAEKLNIPLVPIVLTGTLTDAVNYVKTKPLSQVAIHNCLMEGLVGKPLVECYTANGGRVVVKIKQVDFE